MKILFLVLFFIVLVVSQEKKQFDVLATLSTDKLHGEWKTASTVRLYPINSQGRPLWDDWLSLQFFAVREVADRKDSTYTLIHEEKPPPTDGWIIKTMTGITPNGAPFERVEFSLTLGNQAHLKLFFEKFPNGTEVPLLYLMYPIPKENVKFSFELTNWIFADLQNELEIEMIISFSTIPKAFGPLPETYDGLIQGAFVNFTRFDVSMNFQTFAFSDGIPYGIPQDFAFLSYRWWFHSFTEKLQYDPDFTILVNSEPSCPNLNNCNNQGTCVQDNKCFCDLGFKGADCSEIVCPNDCNGNGVCYVQENQVKCSCNLGWRGSSCNIPNCPHDPDCALHGLCNSDVAIPFCICSENWTGPECTIPICQNSCSGHGICHDLVDPPRCLCSTNYTGIDCSEVAENCSSTPSHCVHGNCNSETGLCECTPGWIGSDCTIPICPGYDSNLRIGNCHFRGICDSSVEPHQCICNPGWEGNDCGTPICPDCSGNGICYVGGVGSPICDCDLFFAGDDCSFSLAQENNPKKGKGLSTGAYAGIIIGVVLFVVIVTVVTILLTRDSSYKRLLTSLKNSKSTNSNNLDSTTTEVEFQNQEENK